MLKPTIFTWTIIIFGIIFIFIPMLYINVVVLLRPKSQKSKDLLIGKGEDWRDRTHFKVSYGIAVADCILWFPLFLAAFVGVLLGFAWGYGALIASGTISLYINIMFWFSEREYVFPSQGPLVYYTYYWGFFVYWGVVAIAYGLYRLNQLTNYLDP